MSPVCGGFSELVVPRASAAGAQEEVDSAQPLKQGHQPRRFHLRTMSASLAALLVGACWGNCTTWYQFHSEFLLMAGQWASQLHSSLHNPCMAPSECQLASSIQYIRSPLRESGEPPLQYYSSPVLLQDPNGQGRPVPPRQQSTVDGSSQKGTSVGWV